MSDNRENTTSNWDSDPGGMMDYYQAMSYTLGQSIADLVDNSYDAGAERIDIGIDLDGFSQEPFIRILDDGKGISSDEIDNVIRKYQMIDYRDTLVKNLSHGQQKRVCLMRTIIINSNLWLLDEPYSALDSKGIDILNSTIKEAVTNDVAVLMTNHKKIEIEELNVKNFKLEDGKIQ